MGLEGLYGLGCADFGPGRCFNTGRGFLLHELSIRQSLLVFNNNLLFFLKTTSGSGTLVS
jgi:hypothetical protein